MTNIDEIPAHARARGLAGVRLVPAVVVGACVALVPVLVRVAPVAAQLDGDSRPLAGAPPAAGAPEP